MAFWTNLFGRKQEDPRAEAERTREWAKDRLMGVVGVISLSGSGRPLCPSCGGNLPLTVEQMRKMMAEMGDDTVPMTVCHECGCRVRVEK